MALKVKEKEAKNICKRYKNGESGYSISEDYSICTTSVYNLLERNNIERRSNSQCKRKYKINREVFSDIGKKEKYWIGFITADGCISSSNKNQSPIFNLTLALKDIDHLKKFKSFLETDIPIRKKKNVNGYGGQNKQAVISFRSNKIYKKLKEYGVKENKGEIDKGEIPFPKSSDFWRGMIDGDGSITKNGQKANRIYLYGRKYLIKGFENFVKDNTKSSSSIEQKQCGTYIYRVNCSYSKIIAKKLYKNSKVYLERKRNKVKKLFGV